MLTKAMLTQTRMQQIQTLNNLLLIQATFTGVCNSQTKLAVCLIVHADRHRSHLYL